MKEPSDLAKALDVILKNSALEQARGSQPIGYATPPYAAYGEDASTGREAHLRDYWRIIRDKLWLILGITAIISTLSIISESRKPDLYQASARIQVDSETFNPALGASRGGAVLVDNPYMDPEYFNTQVQIISSPMLLRRVAKALDLEHNRTFLSPPGQRRTTWQNLRRMFGYGAAEQRTDATGQGEAGSDDLELPAKVPGQKDDEVTRLSPFVDALRGMVEVDQLKKTHLIDVRCTHYDPNVAAKVVNSVADAFALWNLEVKTQTNSIAGTYLQKRIAELQQQIRTGEEQLVNYAQSHSIISLDANQNTVVERLAGLNRQLLEAENDRKLAEAAYRSNLAPGAAEAAAEINDKQIAELRTRLAEARQKKSQLMVTDTEESPEVKDITQQIASLEKELEKTRTDARAVLITNLETSFRKALDREKALHDAFDKQRQETVTQNEAAINYNILKQEIETNKALLEGLMQRNKENDVTLAGTPNNIHIIDYAEVPGGPIGPRRFQGVFLAVTLSTAFGIALVLFLNYLDDTLNSSGDVENELRLPALAVIPMAGWGARRFLLGPSHNGNGHNGSVLLLESTEPSLHAEAYRHLRTSVLLSTPGRAPRTLLITSSVPSEGKTTTVANMATVLAQTGAKVLMIDADMRRPRLHSLFDMENERGLSTILSSEASDVEIFSMIHQYQDTNLYLLSSGAVPPNPAELIGSEQMQNLLEVVATDFKHIVIDSPPIASFTDGVLLSSMVDGVLLVVHGGKTSRQVAKRTRQMLQEIGAKIIGVVLNKVDRRSPNNYYQSDYSTYYARTNGNPPAPTNSIAPRAPAP